MTSPFLLRRGHAAETLGELSRTTAQWARASGGRVSARVRTDDTTAQFLRFVLVGAMSTVVYGTFFLGLRPWGYLGAHLLATAVSTVMANELHRRLTFRADERVHWFTAQWEAGGVTVIGLLATSTALGWLDAVTGETHAGLQIATVAAVTAFIGLIRFIALRWIFRDPTAPR